MLEQWISMAEGTTPKPILAFVKPAKNHFKGIVSSMKLLINNALPEGLNSVLQLSKYRARGYRNGNNFIAIDLFYGK